MFFGYCPRYYSNYRMFEECVHEDAAYCKKHYDCKCDKHNSCVKCVHPKQPEKRCHDKCNHFPILKVCEMLFACQHSNKHCESKHSCDCHGKSPCGHGCFDNKMFSCCRNICDCCGDHRHKDIH